MTTFKTHINRRSFFKNSAVAGGGMVLGFSWLAACQDSATIHEEVVLTMPDEWFTINAFLKVGDNGVVTIMSPNPEIGQNIKTSIPMIIAEELEVDWNNVVVEQAPLNTEWYQRQVAGGSQSIRFGWEALRKAGATARQMLVNAAAAEWQIDPYKCSVNKGIISGPEGKTKGFGEVASAASTMEVPEEVSLKEPKDYTIIGHSKPNVDIKVITGGKSSYGIDTKVEGMQYAVVMRPQAFGQTLEGFDDSDARKVKGVNEVFQFGDKIAVVANSTWAAMKGQKALKAQYKDVDPESTSYHDKELLALLDKKSTEPRRKDGDVEKAFSEADQVLTKVYEAPFLPHNCLEPMNFFAHVKDDGTVYCNGPIQTPIWTQSNVAKILDMMPEDEDDKEAVAAALSKVHVGMTRMGGGFGRRLYGDFAEEAAMVSKMAGTPIQLVFSREDDMKDGIYRPASKYKIEASLKDNAITGYRLTEACINVNMYGLIPNFFPAGAIENYQVDTHNIQSNITTGAWRAPYTNFLGFAEQSFFDELAEIMNVDPIKMRMDLLEKAKPTAEKDEAIEYDPGRMQDCLKLVAEKANWGKKGDNVFQGVSAYYSHNTHVAEIADVEMENGSPVVKRVYCAVDCGIVINPESAKNQVEGGVVDGIGHAMYGDFSFNDGAPSANNFDQFRLIRNQESPEVEVYFVENELSPTGLGEPSLPPAGGAVANAMYKATGKRVYRQPFVKEMDVLG